MNYYNINGGNKSRHAEVDSIEKLKPSYKKKKINLLVIRCKKDMTLGNSKPCINCVNSIYKDINKKGYKLNKVYFCDDNGDFYTMKV